jgi:beta-glucosidase
MAAGFIKGLQSMAVSATVKHFALNFSEYGRFTVSSDVDERTLHEVYLAAFKAAVQEAGTGAVMCAYNLVNGVYCFENKELIDTLKKTWGFDGILMSDWSAVRNAEGAVTAGLDLEMPFGAFVNAENIIPLIKSGAISEAMIDDKVRRLLRVSTCFGWLDNKQLDDSIPHSDPHTQQIALEAARAGIVLLKNENSILPINFDAAGRIAIIGIQAAEPAISGGGSAYCQPSRVVSMLDAFKNIAGGRTEITYSPGIDPMRGKRICAQTCFTDGDNGRGLRGEYFRNKDFSGSPDLVRLDGTMMFNWRNRVPAEGWQKNGYSVRWAGFIKADEECDHRIYIEGPQHDTKLRVNNSDIVKDTAFDDCRGYFATIPLAKGNNEILVEFINHGGWTDFGVGCEPAYIYNKIWPDAVEAARNSDLVIICTGFDPQTEREDADRTFALDARMEWQIHEIARVTDRLVTIITAGGAVDMLPWIAKTRAVLCSWYAGQEGGMALAEILTGKISPSGKLPVTFDKRLDERSSFSCYHDEDGDKRVKLSDGIFGGYRHNDKNNITPLFPFGFGLSYTTFEYTDMKISGSKLMTVGIDIKNTGTADGAEVVQIYVSDCECSLPRPVKELKGFAKVWLRAGEKKTVTITLKPEAFMYYDPSLHEWILEPGQFKILAGASSADIRQSKTVSVQP